MTPPLPAAITIGATILKDYAVGDTIADRFRAIVRPPHIADACWMTTDQDVQFRAAVAALMLSYDQESAEFQRIQAEMLALRQVSALIEAAAAGLSIDPESIQPLQEPIGLMQIWHTREQQ